MGLQSKRDKSGAVSEIDEYVGTQSSRNRTDIENQSHGDTSFRDECEIDDKPRQERSRRCEFRDLKRGIRWDDHRDNATDGKRSLPSHDGDNGEDSSESCWAIFGSDAIPWDSWYMRPFPMIVWFILFLFLLTRNPHVLRLIPLLVIVRIFLLAMKWMRFASENTNFAQIRHHARYLRKRTMEEMKRTKSGGNIRRAQEGIALRVNQRSMAYWSNRISRTNKRLHQDQSQKMSEFLKELKER